MQPALSCGVAAGWITPPRRAPRLLPVAVGHRQLVKVGQQGQGRAIEAVQGVHRTTRSELAKGVVHSSRHARRKLGDVPRRSCSPVGDGQPLEVPERIAAHGTPLAVLKQRTMTVVTVADRRQDLPLLAPPLHGVVRLAESQRRGHLCGQRQQPQQDQQRTADSGRTVASTLLKASRWSVADLPA